MTTDERLVAELRGLGALLDVPTQDLAPAVAARIAQAPPRTRVPRLRPAVVLAALAVALVLVTAVTPRGRAAFADLLGVLGIELGVDDGTVTPTVGDPLPLADEVSLARARAAVGFDLGVPAALGDPARVYLDRDLPGGVVTMVWPPSGPLPELGSSDVGALLSQFQGSVPADFLRKLVRVDTVVEQVEVGTGTGVWIAGEPHVLVRDADGEPRELRARLADHVLLWDRDGVTLRLESALGRDEAIRIAESLR